MHTHDRRAVHDLEDNHDATIVLTGTTTGIGRATALALAPGAGHLILRGLERQDDIADLLRTVRAAMRPDTRLTYVRCRRRCSWTISAWPTTRYSASTAYAHSKLALVTYSCCLAVHRPSRSLNMISMHPGVISTRLLPAMFSVAGDRPEHAAANIGTWPRAVITAPTTTNATPCRPTRRPPTGHG